MHETFKGWKRKAGCVTLAMACLFTALWVRSFDFGDYVQWNCGCLSANGNLYFLHPLFLDELKVSWDWPEWIVSNDVAADEASTIRMMAWKWRILGFGVGEFKILGMKFRAILIPYWSIVLPLILLSAYVLLSTRRPAKRLEFN